MRSDESGPQHPVVAVSGATGFVGSALVDALHDTMSLVALSRRPVDTPERVADPRAEWRRCDLYSLRQLEVALKGVDVAIYLVHSMLPSARLVQASFADLDLLLADNFGRAAARAGVRQIIYLGGLMPPADDHTSEHLKSRNEVERALGDHGVPVTALRAGLVVGPHGSSSRILVNLVKRLPAMLCPAWTKTRTQPVALRDVIRAMRFCIDREEVYDGAFDIGGPDVVTYRQLMEKTATVLGKKVPMFDVPVYTRGISKAWVAYFGDQSIELVGPLVDSLRHEMVAKDNVVLRHLSDDAWGFEEALRDGLAREAEDELARRTKRHEKGESAAASNTHRPSLPALPDTARSVQRLPRPPHFDIQRVAEAYMRFLPKFTWPIIAARTELDRVSFRLAGTKLVLLELTLAPSRSHETRRVFRVSGGVLSTNPHTTRGRLDFRIVLGGRHVLAAVHDFEPRLPWLLYALFHAPAHLFVMRGFGRYLADKRVRQLPPKEA